METKANYVAVGAFVLAIIVVLFVSVLWVARVQFREEFHRYETFVQGPVTGLGVGAAVRLNGIEVGRVSDIAFDPDNSLQVQVGLKIKDGTPIKEDSVVSLETQGFTGVSYVEITGGGQASPLLVAKPGHHYPIIKSRPSALQQVFENAPDVMAQLVVIADRVTMLLDDKNRQAIADTLQNVAKISGAVADRQGDIQTTLSESAKAVANLNRTLTELQATLGKVDGLSDRAGLAMDSANDAVKKLEQLSNSLNAVVTDTRPQVRDFANVGLPQLTQLLSEIRTLVASLTKVSNELERDPQRFLFGDRREGFNPR
ncbi:ABC transporter substrate-binding protein [Aliidongia dinghuensis]|uniref:ABC transporter substrate-binding protein n=1 Tax=Aliidongia dinghuensis TaxID=1867774 RepID=A0A8J2YR27_9PROT|nr:MlaD family protein [Aliidongia dinghuensis]GGF03363.1 ABC transporter substrate-binding protein [Aliidongia dinghuensis]